MDCPEPINFKTLSSKIKKSKKFNSKDEEGKDCQIEMKLTRNSIIFNTEIKNGILPKEYIKRHSFNKLKQNNLFTIYENIQEIYEQIEIFINKEPVALKKNNNNIIIIISTQIKKYPDLIFELL